MSNHLMELFLDINGYELKVSSLEQFQYTVKLADSKNQLPFEDTVNWIKKHIIKKQDEKKESIITETIRNLSQKLARKRKKEYSNFITLDDGKVVKIDKK